jgi:DNA-binding NtrC family response regulator
MTDPAQDLIGREAEVERVNVLVNRLHEGGGALVISGEAGVGKSALLARPLVPAGQFASESTSRSFRANASG